MKRALFALALLVCGVATVRAEDTTKLPVTVFEGAEKGDWVTFARRNGVGKLLAVETWRVLATDSETVTVSIERKPRDAGDEERKVPRRSPGLASFMMLKNGSEVSDVTSSDVVRTIAGAERHATAITFQITVDGYASKIEIVFAPEIKAGPASVKLDLSGKYAIISEVAGYGNGDTVAWGQKASSLEIDEPYADKPGIVRIRGVYNLAASQGCESGVALFPLPLVWREQAPLSWELHAPAGKIKSWKAVERAPGDWIARVELAALRQGDSFDLDWEANVLVGPSTFEPLPEATLDALEAIPAEAKKWLKATRCVQSSHERFKEIAKEVLAGTKDVASLEKRVLEKLQVIHAQDKGDMRELDALQALDRQTSCTGCANLAAAVFRACGVPARVVSGYPLWSGPLQTHYTVEYWFPGRGWVPIESTLVRAPWPNSQQIQVSIVQPEDEDASKERPTAMGGVPYLSLTEIEKGAEAFSLGGVIPGQEGCDHDATLVAAIAAGEAGWKETLEAARTSWKAWLALAAKGPIPEAQLAPRRAFPRCRTLVDVKACLAGKGPEVPRGDIEWLRTRATEIRSIDPADADYSDLAGLEKAIGDAQVVQLGEQSHGDGATFDAKVRLIKFLHEKMGFDVLAWESGVYDCEKMEQSLKNGDDAETIMRKGIFPIWHSKEVLRVFEYAKKTFDTYRPLTLVGFDCQFSSGSSEGFAKDVRATVSKAFPAFIDDKQEKALDALATRHGDDLGDDERKAGRNEAERLIAFLREKKADFDKALGARVTGWLEKSLRGVLVFDELQKDPDVGRGMGRNLTPELRALLNLRDKTMGENLVWLADEQWKGKKIIVWAATYHAIHAAPTIAGTAADYSGTVTMGEVAHQALGKRLYTIGFTAHHGEVGNPNMEPWRLGPPEKGTLEEFCHTAGLKNAFVDFRSLSEDHWLRKRFGARPLGYANMEADWTRVMDGLVFTDEMYPSTPLGEAKRRQKGF